MKTSFSFNPDVWRYDLLTASNMPSSVNLGVESEATVLTFKSVLRFAVSFCKMTALTALYAAVSGVYENYLHSCKLSFVLNKSSKLLLIKKVLRQ